MTRTQRFLAISAISITIIPGTVFAEDLSARIQALQQEIQKLQQQLQLLEAEQGSASWTHPPFTETLRRGSRGDSVQRLQEFLKTDLAVYPEGIVTGYFGPLTEAAVKRFQEKYGIEAIGIVGPKTRAKLNALAFLINTPTAPSSAPAETATTTSPESSAPATTTPPAVPSGTATTTNATPSVTPLPVPSEPVVIPTPGQLGLPLISFLGWGQSSLKVRFTHDPGSYVRSYLITLATLGQTEKTRFGPYTIPSVGATSTPADGIAFRRLSENVWEWEKTLDLATQAEGTYEATIAAVGDGNTEGQSSPGWTSTLHPAIQFDDLLQDTSERAVMNGAVSRFPLTLRIKNSYQGLYYHYEIFDGSTRVWDSSYIRQSDSDRIKTTFSNVNSYPFPNGSTYRIRAEEFDNNSGRDSQIKQKPAETTFLYSPS